MTKKLIQKYPKTKQRWRTNSTNVPFNRYLEAPQAPPRALKNLLVKSFVQELTLTPDKS